MRNLGAHLVPAPAMGRNTSHQSRLLQAPSNSAFGSSSAGTETTAPGKRGAAEHKAFLNPTATGVTL